MHAAVARLCMRFRHASHVHTGCWCRCAGIIIPPLPEKNVVQKYQMTTEFIEARRRALTVFISRVVHPLLVPCPDLPYSPGRPPMAL